MTQPQRLASSLTTDRQHPRVRGAVFDFPQDRARYFINESINDWNEEIIGRLEELVSLENGWDGYLGQPVRFQNAVFALRVLETVCLNDTPKPQIVPGARGDLQIEWHSSSADIELHVIGPNNVHAWIADEETGPDGIEYELTTDFSLVVKIIRKLSERSVD